MSEFSTDNKLIKSFIRKKTNILSNRELPYSRAMLAKLRNSIGKNPGSCPEVWGILFEDLDERLQSVGSELSYAEEAVYTALTLYAVHQQGNTEPMNNGSESFGTAVKRMIEPDGGNEKSVKKRFDAIVTANDFIELSYHARGLIRQMGTRGIPMDYGRFAADLYLIHFPDSKNGIMLQWGRDYYKNANNEIVKEEEQADDQK